MVRPSHCDGPAFPSPASGVAADAFVARICAARQADLHGPFCARLTRCVDSLRLVSPNGLFDADRNLSSSPELGQEPLDDLPTS